MARHLGTELNACPCYWPRKKGKIERPFNYIDEQFIKGNHFASMEDLNRRGKDFVEFCEYSCAMGSSAIIRFNPFSIIRYIV